MPTIIIEQDAFMRMFAPMLDPARPAEALAAVGDFFAHDAPDFTGWLEGVRARIPALFPATIHFAEDQEDLHRLLPLADACMVESLYIGEAELALAPRLAMVQKYGYLTRNIDLPACQRRGVRVEVQRRRVNVAVAEQAFALMIALCKRIHDLDHVVDTDSLAKAGYQVRPYDKRYTGSSNFARIPALRTLNGATLGVIGMGEVGRELAARAAAFGMKVLYHQRTPLSAVEEYALNATYVSRDELVAQADYISVNLPVTPETRGILGAAQFAAMKPGAMLVNVARSELIDRAALLEALQSGALGGFGTDVWYEEPVLAQDPILSQPNVIIMPHTAIADRRHALDDTEDMFLKMSRALAARDARGLD